MANVGVPKINNPFPLSVRMYLVASDRKPNNGKNNSEFTFSPIRKSGLNNVKAGVYFLNLVCLFVCFPITMLAVTAPSISFTFRSARREMGGIIHTQSFYQKSKSFPRLLRKFPHITLPRTELHDHSW